MHSLTKGDLSPQNESKIRRYRLFALDFGAIDDLIQGEFKHEVRQFEKSYDNQQAEQISLMV